MGLTNRVCKTCGKEYYYCSNCDKTLNSPQWMLMWHDENCKNVFEIVSDYVQKHISKDEAKKRLSACDLTKEYTFKESIRKYIDEINKEDKKPLEEKRNAQPKSQIQRNTSKRNRDTKKKN